MYMQFSCLFVSYLFHGASLLPDNDLEIEGRMRISDTFMNELTHRNRNTNAKGIYSRYKFLSYKNFRHAMDGDKKIDLNNESSNKERRYNLEPRSEEKQPVNKSQQFADEKDAITQDHVENEEKKSGKDTNIDLEMSAYKLTDTDDLEEEGTEPPGKPMNEAIDFRTSHFLEHIVENGKERIKSIADHIQSNLRVPKDTTSHLVKAAFDSYSSKMNKYISYITKREVKSEIDKEFVMLDLVASCNLLLYSEQRKLLTQLTEKKARDVTQYEIDMVTEEVFKQYINHKKQEIFYVCEKLNICRAYPGFSDYLAEFFGELLKMPDTYLSQLVGDISSHIRNRTRFFRSFMRDSVASLIGVKLEAIASNLDDTKETLSVMRSIITQRFKLMKTNDYLLKMRTKAVRILIDIIDKSFNLATGEELTAMTFDTLVQSIRRWCSGEKSEVALPLRLLMEHIVSVVNHNWDDEIREEIATLTEVIMTGKTEDKEILKDLFSRGTAFGKGASLPDDIF